VVNRVLLREGKPYPPDNLQSLEVLPGVLAALTALRAAGFLLIVVTNQPDVARGRLSRTVVEDIHHHLESCLPIDEFRTCFHDDSDHCDCRKPLPGLLIAAASLHQIDLSKSYMIGDRWRDIEAGQRAGCRTIFIDYGYLEKQPKGMNYRTASLADAAECILGEI
jgi:D-glycero-D-manno-heptose 1,7-bisphosphate phosphatase